ncbi:LacI family DNA-binding transcriptional regulator [Roseinatronobacter alkalisoli]|uniref:LacI family DNA-binding transcriptional regulator n=1 Tax=Roseinatronobacter alkalisoli TaxID=3028235 RepID=A0ABT5TGN3_9RHOB|nr:LacI family DNA-binding transcriptional regulator [Roseinatronobacter sp. HJB301]MDD7973516.1 LacI family DNA-binding transcriptional regulator [Roseinatronobacter sp. HJB301]
MSSRGRVTIRDVAAEAGVSIATVSKIVNGQQSFSKPVEMKVREAVVRLGYIQNPAARSMVTGKTTAIGLAIMDIGNPHHASFVKGANRMALAKGYHLLMVDLEERVDFSRQLLAPLAQRTDGLVVSPRLPRDVIEWLAEIDKPVVFVGEADLPGSVCIGLNNRDVGSLLANFLVRQGFAQVAYVGYDRADWNAQRRDALAAAFAETGVKLNVFHIDEPTSEAGEQIASKVLLGGNRFDLIVGCNDLVTIGIMSQAHRFGFRVPEDVAFAGYDNIAISRYVSPPLTTVDTCAEATGEVAIENILALIENSAPPKSKTLEPLLLVRESTARTVART